MVFNSDSQCVFINVPVQIWKQFVSIHPLCKAITKLRRKLVSLLRFVDTDSCSLLVNETTKFIKRVTSARHERSISRTSDATNVAVFVVKR